MRNLLCILCALASAVAFTPIPAMRRPRVACCARRCSAKPLHALASAPAASVVITDMDETLISKKSTGYVIAFLWHYRAFMRILFLLPPLFPILKLLSQFSRKAAVKLMYFFAFRGLSVERAKRVADEQLSPQYVRDLQDPAASAVLGADAAVIITASPSFMARPWLRKYLGVPATNVYGAELVEINGRFTGFLTGDIPMGETKVDLLKESCAAGAEFTTGFGDHHTDVPFLRACNRGVLVAKLPESEAAGCEYVAAGPFDMAKLPSPIS
uniref:Uncharacterized protein n=1 Tax=Haptolina brevifila TaxID=156173 RepID=A0A7S2HLC1_9EUKA|mmetsp:Transcript_55511/g.110263  ORF Transcript_55511/g.110263 Transcript_55511/m.110263 type:complete len:270 (+) Transcript_55511:98-907(+)